MTTSSTARPTRTPRKEPVFSPDLLSGQVVIVTGGGSGLGLAMSQGLCSAGAQVVICGRSPERLGKAVETLRSLGGKVSGIPCDVRDPAEIDQLVRKTVEQHGKIDGLINNAAGNFLCAAEDLSAGGFDAVVKIVLYGSVNATLAVGRHLIGRGAPGSVLSMRIEKLAVAAAKSSVISRRVGWGDCTSTTAEPSRLSEPEPSQVTTY